MARSVRRSGSGAPLPTVGVSIPRCSVTHYGLMIFPLDGNGEEWVYSCCSFPMLGVIRFRRSALRLDRASRILVGLVKKREKQ